MYPAAYRRLLPHWGKRFIFFVLGIVLLYAPFALLTRLVLLIANKPLLGDAHAICLRMPIQWLGQPWMYGTIFSDPTYMVAVLVLPIMALFRVHSSADGCARPGKSRSFSAGWFPLASRSTSSARSTLCRCVSASWSG